MNDHSGNGATRKKTMARGLGDLAHDAVALGELQFELLKAEAGRSIGKLVRAAIMAVVAVVVVLGSIPLILLTAGEALFRYTELARWQAFGIVTLLGLLLAGGLGLAAWQIVKRQAGALDRSKQELKRNLQWFKRASKSQAA